MNPIDAKTNDQICMLKNDNIETASGMSMLLAEKEISLHPVDSGGFHIVIPRDDWDEMIAWYIYGEMPAGNTDI